VLYSLSVKGGRDMKVHDTQGFIRDVAKVAVKKYKMMHNAVEKAWFIRDHYSWLNMCIHETTHSAWFFAQRGSYQSTLRWKIFIQFTEFMWPKAIKKAWR